MDIETKVNYGPDGPGSRTGGGVRCDRAHSLDYELGRTGPPVRDPGPSGPYLSWVADFILGNFAMSTQHHKN